MTENGSRGRDEDEKFAGRFCERKKKVDVVPRTCNANAEKTKLNEDEHIVPDELRNRMKARQNR